MRGTGAMVDTGVNNRPGQGLAVVVGAGAMAMAIARRLGGANRLLIADRDATHLERQVVAVRAEGHDAEGVVCDVTDPEAVDALAGAAAASGPFHALAHVVGVAPATADSATTILEVNLIGPALVADAFLPIAEAGSAALFVASMAAYTIDIAPAVMAELSSPLAPDLTGRVSAATGAELTPELAYQLSKAAVVRMCRDLARDWARRGARIVSLSPGLINTPMGAASLAARPGLLGLLERTPLRRQGTMLEVADAAEFLLSPRASYITGTDLLVDGGTLTDTSLRA